MMNFQLLDQKWISVPSSIIYRFISFNRTAIFGRSDFDLQRIWIPANQKVYRWIYIMLTALFTGFIVNHFTVLLDSKFGLNHVGWREYAICFGQILWQFMFLTALKPSKRLNYLGNMSTISLIGSLLLLPLFIVHSILDLDGVILLSGFGMVVGIMFLLHLKRCISLELPIITSISWITYRTLVLLVIIMSLM